MYSMWLGNLVFVPFVLLGVSDDLFTLSSGKIKAGKSVVTVTAETRGHWMSINRCLSPKKKKCCSVCSLEDRYVLFLI